MKTPAAIWRWAWALPIPSGTSTNKTLEECRALGVNDSMIHEDFMIGSADLSIDAVCDGGKVVPIFRNGTWAF